MASTNLEKRETSTSYTWFWDGGGHHGQKGSKTPNHPGKKP